MAIYEGARKKVTEEWQKAFPDLILYEEDKLYKIVGPIIIGLELIKLPRTDEYRPHFVIYPLWKINIKACLDHPFILKDYHSRKGMQYSIPYDTNSFLLNDVLEIIKEQTELPFDSNIHTEKVIGMIENYAKVPPLSAAPNSYLQAELQEAKLKIALYLKVEETQIILKRANEKNWDTDHFKACGANVGEWLKGLHDSIENRDEFLHIVQVNNQSKKIAQLNRSELI